MFRYTGVWFAWLAVAVIGCNERPSDFSLVSGQVTLDGKPLSSGTVITIPESGGKGARGVIDSSGHFELETPDVGAGARHGMHRVGITAFATTGESSGPEKQLKSLVPPKYTNAYNSGLTIDVKADEVNEVTMDLSSVSTK